jgi:hypothetical protein
MPFLKNFRKIHVMLGVGVAVMPMPRAAQSQVHEHAATTDSSGPPGVFSIGDVRGRIGLMAIGLVSRVSPAYGGRTFTEGYLTQPNLMADMRWHPITFTGTLNFEGYTLDRGELTPGIYGEGYADRRHPHTLLHEAMLSLSLPGTDSSALSASLSVGKGFAPYGTDDPMMRPFGKYPVNHHHAQILERAQITGAIRFARGGRDISVEAGVFNGDEPTGPFGSPTLSRITDSRAVRVTLRPIAGLEGQVSAADITSPDIIQGGASDHAMKSASLRWSGEVRAAATYAMVEVEQNEESHRQQIVGRYESILAEGMASWKLFSIAARWERTDRPEGERLLDPFRTPVGHIDFQLLGITRWTTSTIQLAGPSAILPRAVGARLTPFVEVARAVPSAVVLPTVFEPEAFYGARVLWSYSIGVRMHLGTMRARMGRYGVAMPRVNSGATAAHQH